jgi:hypothetical protein
VLPWCDPLAVSAQTRQGGGIGRRDVGGQVTQTPLLGQPDAMLAIDDLVMVIPPLYFDEIMVRSRAPLRRVVKLVIRFS